MPEEDKNEAPKKETKPPQVGPEVHASIVRGNHEDTKEKDLAQQEKHKEAEETLKKLFAGKQ